MKKVETYIFTLIRPKPFLRLLVRVVLPFKNIFKL